MITTPIEDARRRVTRATRRLRDATEEVERRTNALRHAQHALDEAKAERNIADEAATTASVTLDYLEEQEEQKS